MSKQRSYSYARSNPLPLPFLHRVGEGMHIFLSKPKTSLAGGAGAGHASLLLHMLLARGREPGESGSTTPQSCGREVLQCQKFSGHSQSPRLQPSTVGMQCLNKHCPVPTHNPVAKRQEEQV